MIKNSVGKTKKANLTDCVSDTHIEELYFHPVHHQLFLIMTLRTNYNI